MAKKSKKIAVLTLFATAWLVSAIIWAGVFVIVKHDHEHIDSAGHPVPNGENCHICLEIQIAIRLIESFGRLGVSIAVISFITYALSFVKLQQAFCPLNPIGLKVKFNC
jgi:hypothetical protein